MGTEIISIEDRELFLWSNSLNVEDYVIAMYYLETRLDPEFTAIAIAMEQSATTTKIAGTRKFNLSPYTARVISVEIVGETDEEILPFYRLNTSVYEGQYKDKGYYACKIKIAFPILNFERSIANLWNALGGEIHRIGFLNTINLISIEISEAYLERFRGPLYGIEGIRERLGIKERPIFVRSTRPAVGLKTEEMAEIAKRVLKGGFDGIKDDELTVDNSLSPFEERVKKLVEIVKDVEAETGERKFYIANVIDDPLKSMKLAEIATKMGADALVVSPGLQGLGIVGDISRMTGLPILAHNSWTDVLTRHPKFGVSEQAFITIQRLAGADMIMLPGNFATDWAEEDVERECISSCRSNLGKIRPSLPVIAGGKTPDRLKGYIERIGSPDFLLIAATAVDTHPEGIEAGARAFREAWELTKGKGRKQSS